MKRRLGGEMVSPKRKIGTLEELLVAFPDVVDMLIDGTERPVHRPKDDEKQKENLEKVGTTPPIQIIVTSSTEKTSYKTPSRKTNHPRAKCRKIDYRGVGWHRFKVHPLLKLSL